MYDNIHTEPYIHTVNYSQSVVREIVNLIRRNGQHDNQKKARALTEYKLSTTVYAHSKILVQDFLAGQRQKV